MFPEKGYTKGDVLEFYQRIAPLLLPHLRDRPITVERLPGGMADGAPRFWQKHTPPHYPKWIPRVKLPTEAGDTVEYALVNDEPTLLYFVNQGAICFHPFLSRVQNLDQPDYVFFDLDRGKGTFGDIIQVARAIHEVLDAQDVNSFPKTSGKSGLHIVVPWRNAGGYDAARAWAESVARVVIDTQPKLATLERQKAKRGKRVYIDVVQNAKGHHIIPPYVLRATAAATVSTPLDWKEVNARLNPAKFDIKSIFTRLKKRKGSPSLDYPASMD